MTAYGAKISYSQNILETLLNPLNYIQADLLNYM